MKRTVLCVLLSLFVLIFPLLLLLGVAFLTPPVYDESFVGILDEKVERMRSTEKAKIVVIGGSSVAFGLDSALLAEETGKEVVNFGLYAALGTKVMMELSKSGIRKGDTVILMPEMDEQTLSLYFGAGTAWRAMEDEPSLFFSLPVDDRLSMLGALYDFVKEKCGYLLSGEKSRTNDIYAAENFNEYGDLSAYRAGNVMANGTDASRKITLTEDILSDEFVAYVSEYIAYCERKGATVYFGWCPMNALAVSDTSDEALLAFADAVAAKIPCQFLGDIRDAVMEPGYFYDTDFHLNTAGATAHTLLLARDYWETKGVDYEIQGMPDAPELSVSDYTIDRENGPELADFILEEMTWYNPATEQDEFCGYAVVGLTETGKTKTELTLPVSKDGGRVCRIKTGALSGGAVETLILPAELSMGLDNSFVLDDGFDDGSPLARLVSYVLSGNEVRPPSPGAWREALTLVIPAAAENYTSYYWSKIGNLSVSRLAE